MPDPAQTQDRPLEGRTVVLIHPAWHSCGSHSVFRTQAGAYRALGAKVFTFALDDLPALPSGLQRRTYMNASADLVADFRDWSAMPLLKTAAPMVLGALVKRLRGDQATLRLEIARRIPIPRWLLSLPKIDLVHCNHFFCMPVAQQIATRSAAPLLLDSHDIQARQYQLAIEGRWALSCPISYERMLAVELEQMAAADLIIHLNRAEAECFQALLPQKTQALLYPTVERVRWTPNGRDFLIVAAANNANAQGVEWLLRDVAPLVPDVPFRIVGSVMTEVRRRAPRLFKANAALFTERVADIESAYATAAAIVLPTVSGHGISIKTIEALSSGAPIVATAHAFRGIDVDPKTLPNVRIADDSVSFASALRATRDAITLDRARRPAAPHPLYDKLFSARAYQTGLAALLEPLLRTDSRAR